VQLVLEVVEVVLTLRWLRCEHLPYHQTWLHEEAASGLRFWQLQVQVTLAAEQSLTLSSEDKTFRGLETARETVSEAVMEAMD